MKLSTRLLLPFFATVVAVMTAFAVWATRQRERTLTEESQRETRAHAVALGLAIDAAFRSPSPDDVQDVIDRISQERTVFGVFVYGPDARMLYVSNPLTPAAAAPADVVRRVLRTGEVSTVDREIDGQAVFAVVRPILDAAGGVAGAFEVTQPLSFLEDEIARTRLRFLLNTLTLLAAVAVLIVLLVRSTVTRPLGRVVAGAQALGRGEFAHRIGEDAGGEELTELASEFNRMAERLESARLHLVRETDERVSLQRRLHETEKLAAVGNLAAGLAHEIAAPLHVIRGRAELLLKREAHSEKEQRDLRIIAEQISRITVIVRNLLDYARPREPRIEPMDVCELVRGVAEFLEWELQRGGVRLTWDGPRSLWVRGDPNLLHQVFINVLLNAVHAMEHANPLRAGERAISIRTHRGDADGTNTGPVAYGAGDWVTIDVDDSGSGIATEDLEAIFEPFFTTRHQGSGTGLGLAVARSIVEEQGGRIAASNLTDDAGAIVGARFRIHLPRAQPR